MRAGKWITLVLLIVSCGGADVFQDAGPDSVSGTAEAPLAGSPDIASWWWTNGYVPVCFLNRQSDRETAWFKDALAATWGGHARIDISYFNTCPPPTLQQNEGRWVEVNWESWRGPGGGLMVGSATGATLNLGFCPDAGGFPGECDALSIDLEEESKGMMVHEFGHAIGFLHEHQRPDSQCIFKPLHPDGGVNGATISVQGAVYLTSSYDSDSIMNYCRGMDAGAGMPLPYFADGGTATSLAFQAGYKGADLLSIGDKVGAKAYYGGRFDYWLLPVVVW